MHSSSRLVPTPSLTNGTPTTILKAAWAVVVLVLLPSVSFSQERATVPAFPAQADAITADVVVLDKDDRPVRGLTREDFTLFEDGKPQSVVAFEARDMAIAPRAPVPGVADERVATDEGGPQGRTLAFLLDDLGTSAVRMEDTKRAIARWLQDVSDPRDEVTLATSSGNIWWSDRVDRGREDLLAVLGRVKGGKLSDVIRDWEAYRIAVFEDATGAAAASASDAPSGGSNGPPQGAVPGGAAGGAGADALGHIQDRVVKRTGMTPGGVRMLAMAHYNSLSRRTRALLDAIERLSRGLAGARGRKSILAFSEGFLYDPDQRALFDRAIDASQRGNTAVYFVDTKGLATPGALGEERPPEQPGIESMEVNYLEASGAEQVAENTGGRSIRFSNGLFEGMTHVTEESSTYYLLGYQPEKSPDGKWHNLEVRVSRPGVKVRTRRGYQATLPPTLEAAGPTVPDSKTAADQRAPKRPLDPAVMTSGAAGVLALRIAPYVMNGDSAGLARVLVVLEIDTSRLALRGAGARRTGAIDLTLLGMSRDRGTIFPVDERVRIDIEQRAAGGWMTLSRELRLPSGVAQVRALVRDVASGIAGTVTQRIDVPSLDAPYISTLIVSDRLLVGRGQDGRVVPVAHRRFQAKGHLYCSYEVVGMTNARGEATTKVAGGFTLRRASGSIVSHGLPTPIAVALGGRVTRLFALPLAGLAPGEYELILDVVDEASGRTLQAREPFVVEPRRGLDRPMGQSSK